MEASWGPSWPPKRAQNEEKSIKNGSPLRHRSGGRFWTDSGAQVGPLEPEKSSSPCSGGCFFHFLRFRLWGRVWGPTWGYFGSTWAPKTSKNDVKMGFAMASEIRSIWGSILDAFWAPSWAPRWAHVGHFLAQKRLPRRIQIFVEFWAPT